MFCINKKKVTTTDIAKAAGVSQSTVSLVLSGNHSSLSASTIQNVLESAKALGYIYKERENSKLPNKNTVIIMSSSLPNPYYSELITSIELAAEEEDLLTIVCDTYRTPFLEEAYLSLSDKLKPVGIIFTYIPVALSAVQTASKRIPIVVVGDKTSEVALDAVEFNSYNAGRLLATEFMKYGHKDIAFLSTPMNTGNIARSNRYEGFLSIMKEHGLEDHLLLRVSDSEPNYKVYHTGNEFSIGNNMALEVLSEAPHITAFVGVNDMIAIGIMNALLSKGFKIPEDYSVAGFDNVHFSNLLSINLTTIDYFSGKKGKDALNILLRNHKSNSSHDPSVLYRMEYTPELIVRGSVGKRRKN